MKEINLNQSSTLQLSDNSELLSRLSAVAGRKGNNGGQLGRPRKLSLDQIHECILLKSQYSIQYWKCLFKLYQKIYPDLVMPVYHNCLSSVYKFFFWLVKAINLILYENRQRFLAGKIKVALIDSTPEPVCHILRSSRHKTMKEFAEFSKGTMGWYFGIKFHIVIDYSTNLPIYAVFTKAKIDDRQVLKQIMEDQELFRNTGTMFVADKGYVKKWRSGSPRLEPRHDKHFGLKN